MNKLLFSGETFFADLPLDHFDTLRFSVYVLDPSWNYLFVNEFVQESLKQPREFFIGKNIWNLFPELSNDPSFGQLKINSEKGLMTNFITISPLTSQRISVTGQPLADCYFFTSSILPKKEDLIDELREILPKAR